MNLAALVEAHPSDAPALVSGGRARSWGQVRAETAVWRQALVELGVRPEDRVAIVAANTPGFVLAYLAVLGVGAVAVPLNPASPTVELARELTVVGARVAVVGPAGAAAVGGLGREVGLDQVVVPVGTDLPGAVPVGEGGMGGNGALSAALVERGGDDLAALLFTAGTAGAPKAAMLTHASLLANLEQMQRHPGRAVRASDVCLATLPFFHVYGLNVVLGLALASGASLVLVERFEPAATLELVTRHKVTVVAGAPPMYAAWAALPEGCEGALATVRLAVSGASPLGPEMARRFRQRFGVELWEGYGLTEASPTLTSSVAGGKVKPGTIGVPLPGVEVRIVDDEGLDALVGDPGEIWARGPNIFSGYWEEPEATAAALTSDGWLRTGDIAVVDDEGYLRIVDRAKDLVIVSGFNVYPAEVEGCLRTHPGISEVAVVGVPHPRSGETVKAFVVAGPGAQPSEDEVIEHCARSLARYKCPTTVVFVDSLPRGPAGKLLRRLIG